VNDSEPRCIFCGDANGKRSKEHWLRKAFANQLPGVRSLTYSHFCNGELEVTAPRPHSQFEITLNIVCRSCNQGWLNDLENEVGPTLQLLLSGHISTITADDLRRVAFWAYVRAILRTHLSPHGRAPRDLFAAAFRDRSVPRGSYVRLGAATVPIMEAGAHQSATIRTPRGDGYLAYIGITLGPLIFLVAIGSGPTDVVDLAIKTSRAPEIWFPNSFILLWPPAVPEWPLHTLSPAQALVSISALSVLRGLQPFDQLGNPIDHRKEIPDEHHASLMGPHMP
jgi:hypothetical protein